MFGKWFDTQEVDEVADAIVADLVKRLPKRKPVTMRVDRAQKILGIKVEPKDVESVFRRLGFTYRKTKSAVTVNPPSFRFDIAIEEDLIEELARIHGYGRIPAALPVAAAHMLPADEGIRTRSAVRRLVADRDYHEVVTYSFIDRRWEADLCGNADPVALAKSDGIDLFVDKRRRHRSSIDEHPRRRDACRKADRQARQLCVASRTSRGGNGLIVVELGGKRIVLCARIQRPRREQMPLLFFDGRERDDGLRRGTNRDHRTELLCGSRVVAGIRECLSLLVELGAIALGISPRSRRN